MKRRVLDWCFIVVGIAGLIFVRIIEEKVFYDPFIAYFKDANTQQVIPSFDIVKLIISHLFRFALNVLFSLIIVHFIFKNLERTKQAFVLMVLAFAVTFPIYLFSVYADLKPGYLLTFYLRRFVIQPIILLLIVPMFYYRKSLEKMKKM